MTMALQYTIFKPKKCEDEADWKAELKAQHDLLAELEQAGAKRSDELQLYLSELVWAVVRGDLSAIKATEMVAGSVVASKEPLQRLFTDVLWMVGFASTELPSNIELRKEFNILLAMLDQRNVLPQRLMALNLETEVLPPGVAQVLSLKKKHNQAKTKARYTITRFNLMREHSEGYARLLCLLERLASCEFSPAASPEEIAESERVFADDVVRLIGFGSLCPNRTVAMALDVYETRLLERPDSVLLPPLLGLLRRFPRQRLTEISVFMLLPHAAAPIPGKAAVAPAPTPPSKPSQLLAVASLVQAGLVNLDEVWSYLDPADAALKKVHGDMMEKYSSDVATIGKVDLAAGAAAGRDRSPFDKAFQSFNRLEHQKLRLAAALISMNCWSHAHRVLQHLQALCKPVLSHDIRTALCDLLKWLVAPYLQKGKGSKPAQCTQAGVETTFAGPRRFKAGLDAAREAKEGSAAKDGNGNGNGHAAAPVALEPSDDFETLLPRIRAVLEHLEYFMHTDLHLLTMMWRVVQQYCKEQSERTKSQVVLDDAVVSLIYKNLLPAASMVPNNPFLSDMMWSVVKQLSSYQRYLIYSCWETMYDSFLLKTVFAKTKSSTKQILKRVVSNADKRDLIAHQSHFHICKLCHSNPIPTLETMLRDLDFGFNINLIQPYVECTNKCPDMTADIMGYMLSRNCAKPAGPDRVFLSTNDATYGPWLQNLGEFCGRFFKKHPQTDLLGLLSIITKRLTGEVDAKPTIPGAPVQFKGEGLIRLVLESIMEHMGGLTTVADMTGDQLICLAGGPRLRAESVAIGKKDDTVRKERGRQALLAAIVEQSLVPVLWHSLSQQRQHFLSPEFAENLKASGGLKLLSLLFDGNHQCLLQLNEFLSQACSREKYASLMAPTREVFSMFEPNLAFLAMRHGLPSYGRAMAAAAAAATKEGEAADGPLKIQEPPAVMELERTLRLVQKPTFEEEGLSMNFYITFWRLSLQDIYTPNEGYERTEASIHQDIKQLEKMRRDLERERNRDNKRELKNLAKEVARLQELIGKLKEERNHHTINHKQVQARLEQEKTGWFTRPSPHATSAFVSDMICARVLTSTSDALFCCHFVRMLIKLKTPGFQFLDFYNSWTIMLTQTIRCCSEREAQIFGVFLRDMMSYVLNLRDDEERYKLEMKDNPAFHRNYYEDPKATVVEWAAFADIKKGHSKWEGRIYKAIRAGLDSEEWMERRNTLLLLSQSYESYPLVEKYAKVILVAIETLRDKEEYADLKTLAASIAVKLRTQRDRWVEKADPRPESKGEKGDAKADDGKADRRSLGKADDGKDGKAGNGTETSHGRDRDRHRNRDADKDEPPEKRSRRDPDDGHKDGRERSSKDLKEAKESRETSDRKRGTDRGGAGHEDRDKRRRSEREELGSGRDRYGGAVTSQPRNALAPPPLESGSYRGGGGGDYGRSRGGYSSSGNRHGDRRR